MNKQPEIRFFIGYPVKTQQKRQESSMAMIPTVKFRYSKTESMHQGEKSLSQSQMSEDKSVGSNKSIKDKKMSLVSSSIKRSKVSSIKQPEIKLLYNQKEEENSLNFIHDDDIPDLAFKKKSRQSLNQSQRSYQDNSGIQNLPNHITTEPFFEELTCNIINCEDPLETSNDPVVHEIKQLTVREHSYSQRGSKSNNSNSMLKSQCKSIPRYPKESGVQLFTKNNNKAQLPQEKVSIDSTTSQLLKSDIPSYILERWKNLDNSHSFMEIAPFTLSQKRTVK